MMILLLSVSPLLLTIALIIFLISFIGMSVILAHIFPLGLYITALVSGLRLSFWQVIGMKMRKVPVHLIIAELIKAKKAQVKKITVFKLETHHLARGDITKVVDALIAAGAARMNLTFENAARIDLAGRDVLKAVRGAINTEVINVPTVKAITFNGILLKIKARITVRPRLDQLVGSAGEDTVIARVCQGIVAAVGRCQTYKLVLEEPNKISELIIKENLMHSTAFELLSVDIAQIDVVKNIRAEIEIDEANANMILAKAKAQELYSRALADEAYQRAKIQQQTAGLLLAQSFVPDAISTAFRLGKI